MTYRLIKSLIAAGKVAGLYEKIDVLYLADRLTKQEYQELLDELDSRKAGT